jgi:hypothetical protein
MYALYDRGFWSQFPAEVDIFLSLMYSDHLWGPSSLLSNGCQRLFCQGNKPLDRGANRLPVVFTVGSLHTYKFTVFFVINNFYEKFQVTIL